jgi:hypothetical protein
MKNLINYFTDAPTCLTEFEKILCVDNFITLLFVIKKGFENTLFGIRGGGKHPPSRTNIYIYIYIYKGK